MSAKRSMVFLQTLKFNLFPSLGGSSETDALTNEDDR